MRRRYVLRNPRRQCDTDGREADDQRLGNRPLDFGGDGLVVCDIGAVEMSGEVIFSIRSSDCDDGRVLTPGVSAPRLQTPLT